MLVAMLITHYGVLLSRFCSCERLEYLEDKDTLVFIFVLIRGMFTEWQRGVRQGMVRDLIGSVRTRASILTLGLPLLLAISVLLWFSVSESSHRWNNPSFGSTNWSPLGNTASLASVHLIQGWNWRYIEREYGSFDSYLRAAVGGPSRQNHFSTLSEIPARTAESEALSRDLKRRGFAFVGPTICYAFMQAVGLVNDHLVSCPRHAELGGGGRSPWA